MRDAKSTSLPGILVFAALCGLAAWIWVPDAPQSVIRSRAPTDTVGTRITDGVQQLAELIPVTTERPLFHASRRPVQVAAPAPAPAAPEPTLSLVGILGEDGTQIALVRISGNAELFRVEAGGQLGAWKILAIGDSFVQVSKDDGDPEFLTIGE